jgi:hypothetical protein
LDVPKFDCAIFATTRDATTIKTAVLQKA